MGSDFYEVLQITPDATFDDVHRAYRALAMQFHPDRNSAPGAGLAMAAINEAYAVLSDRDRRREYDRERMAGVPGVAGPILRAAQETLLRQGWIVAENNNEWIVLEQGF